jgi:hypothetical protein
MFKLLQKILTNNNTEIPLLWLTFDLKKYRDSGIENTCIAKLHPIISKDEFIKKQLKSISDHIRTNYNVEEL